MRELTLKQYTALQVDIALGYGAPNVTHEFTATPSVEQRLHDKIVEQSKFLGLINVLPVDEMEGENLLAFANGPVSGRTDTSGDGERIPRSVLGLTVQGFKLAKTNADVFIKYDTMDMWAKFKDFADRYLNLVHKRKANDREIIGWNGESVADTTDLGANPLMQDVNKGWMQYMREKLAGNVLLQGEKEAGEIRIGAGGDYENLDHAIVDLALGIPEYLRDGLVAMVGSELMGRERAAVFKALNLKPSEKALAEAALASFGGLPAMTPTNFPARGLVITSLDNLSIYYQSGSVRRRLQDKPSKDRVEDFNSSNEGYVVETPEKMVAVEFKNVKLPNAAATGWE